MAEIVALGGSNASRRSIAAPSDFTHVASGETLFPVTFSGTQAQIDLARDDKVAASEDPAPDPGSPTHPFQVIDWESMRTFGDNTAVNWHFFHSGDTGGPDFARMCCVSIASGQTAAGEWPMRP